MWGTVGWEGQSQGTGLLVTGLSNIIAQVTATDLQNGTSHVGPVWTKVGSVPYNAGDNPRPSVGPFSAGNYYSLPSANVINQLQSLTIVAVVRTIGGQVLLATGVGSTTGFYISVPAAGNAVGINLPATGLVSSDAIAMSQFGVAFTGWDNVASKEYAKVGGGAMATSVAAGPLAVDSGITTLGQRRDGFGITGYLYELAISTNTPSDAAFNAIYAAIVANK